MHGFGWKYNTKTSEVIYTIPSELKWAEDTESNPDGTIAYLSNLPLWGTAELDDEEGLKIGLRYLTAILRIDLTNVKGNIKNFIVEAYSDEAGENGLQIAGDFKAVLATKAVVDANTKLETIDGEGDGKQNSITVDLTGVETESTYIFVPIIARDYGLLKYYYTPAEGGDPIFISQDKTVTRARARYYRVAKSFEVAGNDIPALNRAMEVQKDLPEIDITTAQTTTIASTEGQVDRIIIPEDITNAPITLNLKGLTGGSTAAEKILYVEAAGEYTGKLTINVPGTLKEDGSLDASNVKNVSNVYVNLPLADVVIAGNWDGVNLGDTKNVDNSLNVKTLTIAADAIVKGIYPNAVCCLNNTGDAADILVSEGSEVNKSKAKVTTLTLKNNADIDNISINDKMTTVNAAVSQNDGNELVEVNVTLGGKATITTLKTNQKLIEVPAGTSVTGTNGTTQGLFSYNGADVKVQGTVGTLKAYNGGSIYVNGETGKITTLHADNTILTDAAEGAEQVGYLEIKDKGSVGTANVRGASVFVNRSESGTAITTLNMGDGKTLNLQGGVITTLNGTDIEDGITFKNKENAGVATAIGTVKNIKLKADYTSTWGGATASAATTTNDTDKEIWTASQLYKYLTTATQSTAAKLVANVDLGENAITPAAKLAATFDGNFKTIKGGVIEVAAAANNGYGLFKELNTGAEVKNLLIDGLTVKATGTAANYSVGSLAGIANAGTITNVHVKDVTLKSDNYIVGGMIGKVTGTVTVTGKNESTVTGDNPKIGSDAFSTVSATEITGKNKLGGLVGVITGSNASLTVSLYKTAVKTFSATEARGNEKIASTTHGTVSMYVGTVEESASATVTAVAATEDLTWAQRHEMNFDHNFVNDVAKDVSYLFVGRKEFGYILSATTIKVGTTIKATDDVTKLETLTANNANVASAAKANVYLNESNYPAAE